MVRFLQYDGLEITTDRFGVWLCPMRARGVRSGKSINVSQRLHSGRITGREVEGDRLASGIGETNNYREPAPRAAKSSLVNSLRPRCRDMGANRYCSAMISARAMALSYTAGALDSRAKCNSLQPVSQVPIPRILPAHRGGARPCAPSPQNAVDDVAVVLGRTPATSLSLQLGLPYWQQDG